MTMKLATSTQRTMLVLVSALAAGAVNGCAADEFELAPVEDLEMESAAETGDEITARYPAGTTARTTASLNLRSGPSTSNRVILVMPSGSRVTLTDGVPQSGWYRVGFNGHSGWAFGQYLTVSSSGGSGSGGTSPGGGGGGATGVDFAGQLARASSGEGFSYWWGHGRWLDSGPSSSTRGSCSGSCPSCSHGGSYGADCSGFVAKVWRVPSSNAPVSVDSHPYHTGAFRSTTGGGQWSQVSRGNVRGGDALVYNNGRAGHIVWVRGGDGWGAMDLYEARGCSYGIVRNTRSLGGDYVAIRRN
jgi:uncharacterized protein YraI